MARRWVMPGYGPEGTLEVPPDWKGSEVKDDIDLMTILAWNIQKLLQQTEDADATPQENKQARLEMARAALRELNGQSLALNITAQQIANGDREDIRTLLMHSNLYDRLMMLWPDREFPLKIVNSEPDMYPESLEDWAMSVAN